jgi:hypothetical protein
MEIEFLSSTQNNKIEIIEQNSWSINGENIELDLKNSTNIQDEQQEDRIHGVQ